MDRKLLYAALAVIILGGATYYYVSHHKAQLPEEVSTQNLNQNTNQVEAQTQANYTYDLKYAGDKDYADANFNFDASIVRTNTTTGKQEILIPSIKKAYSGIAGTLTLAELTYPKGSAILYFTVSVPESDAPVSDIISFNTVTKTFKKLSVSAYYAGFRAGAAAPTKAYVYSNLNPTDPTDERSLYVLDLEQDKAKLITKLPADQTFNSCSLGCLGDFSADIKWLDDNTIEAKIYDANNPEKDQYGNPILKLVATKQYKIN